MLFSPSRCTPSRPPARCKVQRSHRSSSSAHTSSSVRCSSAARDGMKSKAELVPAFRQIVNMDRQELVGTSCTSMRAYVDACVRVPGQPWLPLHPLPPPLTERALPNPPSNHRSNGED